jgi:hypothetical protein
MNPFVFMNPYVFDDQQQLRNAREHAEMLRREWQQANGRSPRSSGPGTLLRARTRVGRAFIALGRRLAPTEPAGRRVAIGIRRPDVGC